MYVSLHNRSCYSFGSALTTPQQLVSFACDHRMPAIALTDCHGLYAAVQFQQACLQAGVQPIFGSELHLAEGPRLTLLAASEAGYAHLCRLVTLHHLRQRPVAASAGAGEDDPLRGPIPLPETASLTLADVAAHAEGLLCLLGRGPGEAALQQAATVLGEPFAGRLYVELAIHEHSDIAACRRRAAWSESCGLPLVASCESRCLRHDQATALRALASIGTLTLLDQSHPGKPSGSWHLRSPVEMQALFRCRPEVLTRTLDIAEQCAVRLDLNRNRFPAFPSPDGRSAIQRLRELCAAGCRRRYVERPPQLGIGGPRPTLDQALARLERELAIIEQVHYAEYFLVFHEIVEYCRSQGIATLARGSAADSLVCYALGVSHACPFRFDLPFDRFINPERARFSKMADIDLDLPWDRRDQVIHWIHDRFGSDRVAMIGAQHTFHARAAVAELGKVFGLPPHEVHGITKRLPHTTAHHLRQSIARSPEARDLPLHDEPYRTMIDLAAFLEGLPHHWSMHPCGLVVSPEPLSNLVPVQRSPKGHLITQYDMHAIEDLGFVKIDLLGQAGLSVLRDAVAEIERTSGMHVDLEADVDYSDAGTWELIASGQARGVHHIESPAMTSLLQQCACHDIDCLTTVVAIIRPGAANQGKKERFARRYQGFEAVTFPHPAVQSVLEKTYGLMVFEEQILQVAVDFAGMNLGQADVLRRALNKENHTLIAQMKTLFYRGALGLGRRAPDVDAVWSMLEGFCGFMFNKAHSAEYAVEAFQGAWLKLRWPAHYLAAILSNYRGFYAHSPTLPQILYVLEALRCGAGFRCPCVNASRPGFSIEYASGPDGSSGGRLNIPLHPHGFAVQPMVRVPLTHIHGLSQQFALRHQAERQRGPFASLDDFLRRCRPTPADAQLLLDSGALDALGSSRPALFWELRRRSAQSPRDLLWDDASALPAAPPDVPLTSPAPRQVARREMELLGFPISIDPLTYLGTDDHGAGVDWSAYVPVDQLHQYLGQRVQVCGLMVADRINATRSHELMKFVTLADRSGFVEALLFPDTYQRFGHLTVAHPILAASGIVEPFENRKGFTLRVQHLTPPARTAQPGAPASANARPQRLPPNPARPRDEREI